MVSFHNGAVAMRSGSIDIGSLFHQQLHPFDIGIDAGYMQRSDAFTVTGIYVRTVIEKPFYKRIVLIEDSVPKRCPSVIVTCVDTRIAQEFLYNTVTSFSFFKEQEYIVGIVQDDFRYAVAGWLGAVIIIFFPEIKYSHITLF